MRYAESSYFATDACIDCPGSVFALPPSGDDPNFIDPTEAMGLRGIPIVDDPRGLPLTREQLAAGEAACWGDSGCAAMMLVGPALVGTAAGLPAAEALTVRGLVTLGPAAPGLMQFGAGFTEGFAVPGPPPANFAGAVGFAAGRAFSYVRGLFSRGQ